MQGDTLAYDSLESRPLPKWLLDQKSGVNTLQPDEMVMKEDHTLMISIVSTVVFILLAVGLLTFLINRKQKKQAP